MAVELLVLLTLILLNGFFSLSEMAVVSSRKARLRHEAERGRRKYRLALETAEKPSRFLSTIQVVITLIGTLTGDFGGVTIARGLTRQLATLVDAGLPLLRGLHVLQRQTPNATLKEALAGMCDSVESGSTFSESLANYPKIFDNLYINMVRAGEAGGVLELVLTRLSEFMEKSQKIKNKVKRDRKSVV